MLIDVSYFTRGERQIVNAKVNAATANELAVKDMIEGYIDTLEDKFLFLMVGRDAADAIADAKVEIYQKIADKLKESFADYVMFHILRDVNNMVSVSGFFKIKNANDKVSPVVRQTTIWNSMVQRNLKFVEWASGDECPVKIRTSLNMLSAINSMNL